METPAERHCLICYKKPEEVQTNLTSKNGISTDGPSSSSQSLSLWRNARALFVLRNIFEVPKVSVEKYFEFVSKYIIPSDDWVDLCQQCNENVREARECYEELIRISKTFQNLKHKMIQTVRESDALNCENNLGSSSSQRKRSLGTLGSGIVSSILEIFRKITLEETRGFVLQKNHSDENQMLIFLDDPSWLSDRLKQISKNEKKSPGPSSSLTAVDELINEDGRWFSTDLDESRNDNLVGKDPIEETLENLSLVQRDQDKNSPDSEENIGSCEHLESSSDSHLPLVSMSPFRRGSSSATETPPQAHQGEILARNLEDEMNIISNQTSPEAENVHTCKSEGCERTFYREEMLQKHEMLEHGLNLFKTGDPNPAQEKRQKLNNVLPSTFLNPTYPVPKRKRGRPPKPKDPKLVKVFKTGRKVGRPKKILRSQRVTMPTLFPVKTEQKEKVGGSPTIRKRNIPSTRMPTLSEQVRRKGKPGRRPKTKTDDGKPRNEMKRENRDECLVKKEQDVQDQWDSSSSDDLFRPIDKSSYQTQVKKEQPPPAPVAIKRKRGRPPTKNLFKVDKVQKPIKNEGDRLLLPTTSFTFSHSNNSSSTTQFIAKKRKRGRPKKSDSIIVPVPASIKISSTAHAHSGASKVEANRFNVESILPCSTHSRATNSLGNTTPTLQKRKPGRPSKRLILLSPFKDAPGSSNLSPSNVLINDSQKPKRKRGRPPSKIKSVKREMRAEEEFVSGTVKNEIKNEPSSSSTRVPVLKLEKLPSEQIPGINSHFLKVKLPSGSSDKRDADAANQNIGSSSTKTSSSNEDGNNGNKPDETAPKKRGPGRPKKIRVEAEAVTPKVTDEENVAKEPLVSYPIPLNSDPWDPPAFLGDFLREDVEEVSIKISFKCHLCGTETDNQKNLEHHLYHAHILEI